MEFETMEEDRQGERERERERGREREREYAQIVASGEYGS